jgi:poly(3-hydroxybutyrate) depolymerase
MLGGPGQSLAAASVVARAGAQGPGHPAVRGRVEILRLPSGDADRSLREVWVYRPPGADRAERPVVYFLHGYPGNDRNGESVGLPALLDQASAALRRGFVVALPDGGSTIHPDTEWADSAVSPRTARFAFTIPFRGSNPSPKEMRSRRWVW